MIYYKQESFDIIGAAMYVYNTLGHGFKSEKSILSNRIIERIAK